MYFPTKIGGKASEGLDGLCIAAANWLVQPFAVVHHFISAHRTACKDSVLIWGNENYTCHIICAWIDDRALVIFTAEGTLNSVSS